MENSDMRQKFEARIKEMARILVPEPDFVRFMNEVAALTEAYAEGMREGQQQMREKVTSRPRIVCLCGSTRFHQEFAEANYRETMAGKIVLSVGFYANAKRIGDRHGENIGCTPEQKIGLDELHKRKIDLADEVLVLNVEGYIGSSTRSEIDYAERIGKPVYYLEPLPALPLSTEDNRNG